MGDLQGRIALVTGGAQGIGGRDCRRTGRGDVVFDDSFPLGSVVRNTSRNASNWVADPSFGRLSGRAC